MNITLTLSNPTVTKSDGTLTITAPLTPELEAQLPVEKNWRAEDGGDYFYVTTDGGLYYRRECGSDTDTFRWNTRNYFRTHETAERYRELLLVQGRLIRKRDELGGFESDGVESTWQIGRLRNGTFCAIIASTSSLWAFKYYEEGPSVCEQFVTEMQSDLTRYYELVKEVANG